MILHISHLNKFIVPFIELVKTEFPGQDHQFWLSGAKRLDQFALEPDKHLHFDKRTYSDRLLSNVKLFIMLNRADKVILHGLNRRAMKFLLLQPSLLKKCYWIIRGADLYKYQEPRHGFKDRLRERQRAFVIRRMGNLVTYIPGDVELARQWYGATGKYQECLLYMSNVADPRLIYFANDNRRNGSRLRILVGNSSDPSNNHEEVFEKLRCYKDSDIEVHVPLSYGDREHAAKVLSLGRELFGDKFFPLTRFMGFNDYLELLSTMDIAVFNHNRQQAMGNTIALLGLAKTVYMRSDVTQWDVFQRLGLSLRPVSDLSLSLIPEAERRQNSNIVLSQFSREKLVQQLSDIFRN
ncbi:TDP-N-acetylfucosamine:lipid II N-acetylfucosaminyltransferase [Marinobacter sp.]|uniref:TDP-N-acetylfucosamine:lipid II N-acetylfucosaminyltransferase n=1 Tax=Marinobacter sp. TaxID=50741 RepID=UPI00356B21DA